jgi:hypothetical protein
VFEKVVRALALAAVALVLAGAAAAGDEALDRLPTNVVKARVRAAVRASKAHVLVLRIARGRLFSLTVKAKDPARFLKHRFFRVVNAFNRYTAGGHFTTFTEYLAVEGPAGGRVFWYSTVGDIGSSETNWGVRPSLEGCILNIDLPIEASPDEPAPCPVP